MNHNTPRHVRRSRSEWRERVREQEASGLSVSDFALNRGLKPQAFYAWRSRLRREASSPAQERIAASRGGVWVPGSGAKRGQVSSRASAVMRLSWSR